MLCGILLVALNQKCQDNDSALELNLNRKDHHMDKSNLLSVSHLAEPRPSNILRENEIPDLGSRLAKHVSPDIWIPKHSIRIHLPQHSNKVIKARIEGSETCGFEAVGFSPVRPTVVSANYGFELGREGGPRCCKCVWPILSEGDRKAKGK